MAAVAESLERYTQDSFGLWDQRYCVTERVSDELLAFAYTRFKAEGLLPYIFYENGKEPPSLTWFMQQFSSEKMDVLACLREEPDKRLTLGGFTWLLSKTDVGRVFAKAEVGQGFFRDFHNTRDTLRWARLSTEYAFRFLGVDLLIGSTPSKNRAAVIAARRTGFEIVGEIPHCTLWEGEPCGVILSHMTKERWKDIS